MKIDTSFTIPASYNDSKIFYYNNELLLSAHNTIIKISRSNMFSNVVTIQDNIIHFLILNHLKLICSEKKIYLIKNNTIIANFKREVTCINSIDDFKFVIGYNNNLEIWEIPTTYKFMMFNRMKAYKIHNNKIIGIININNKLISWSNDLTVKETSLETDKTRIIWKSKTQILYCTKIQNEYIIVNTTSIIIIDEITNNIKNIIKIDEIIIKSISYNNLLVIITKNNTIIVYKDMKEIIKINWEKKEFIESIALDNYLLGIKTTTYLYNFDLQLNLLLQEIPICHILYYNIIKTTDYITETNKNIIIIGINNNNIVLLEDNKLEIDLKDNEFKGQLIGFCCTKNILYIISNKGYISLWNYHDKIKFKSFTIEKPIIKCTYINDILICQTDVNTLILIENGCIIDSFQFNGILLFNSYNNAIYVLTNENIIIKQPLFNTNHKIFTYEKTIVDFKVKYNKLIIKDFNNSISIYNATTFKFETNYLISTNNKNDLLLYDFDINNLYYIINNQLYINGKIINSVKLYNPKNIQTENGYILILDDSGLIIYNYKVQNTNNLINTNCNIIYQDNYYLTAVLLNKF